MPKDIYLEYNIDVNKLTRDYQKFPLKKVLTKSHYKEWEKISKEEFVYLYIECNIPRKILAQYFNLSDGYINKLCKLYGIKKSPNQWLKNSMKTNIERYGVENSFQSPIVQEKRKHTFIEKYGVENVSQSDICKEKKKQTCLKHFGVENPNQSPIIKEKKKQTCLNHLGVENPAQSPIVLEKMKQTNLERYGVENYTQTDEYKNLYKDEEFVKNKQQKQYETKKKNGTFGKSEEEDEIYDILLTKFKEVKRQYKSDLYPFVCDFYIPEIDLYVEYQGYFQHGTEPYIGTDEQKEIIKEWENKPQKNPQYLRAIDTWTKRDPLKRNIAKQNNLNWIEFFTMKEFTQWFEKL